MAKIAYRALEDKKGEDIKIIDIEGISVLADYFLIASGSNESQIRAMVDNVEEELEKYGMYKKKFLSVKPGLTGYWQANGRNLINYENGRKEMELYYIDHQSIGLDLKILAQTVFAVIKGRGAQ